MHCSSGQVKESHITHNIKKSHLSFTLSEDILKKPNWLNFDQLRTIVISMFSF